MQLGWVLRGAFAVVLIVGCTSRSSDVAEQSSSSSRTSKQAVQASDGSPGVVDTTHKYAVGVCNGSSCSRRCSGALILPNLVATARHCVDSVPPSIKCSQMQTFGARHGGGFFITTNDTLGAYDANDPNDISVQSVVTIPNTSLVCGNDLALLVLSKSVSPTIAKPITPNVQRLMWDPGPFLPIYTAIGYGTTTANDPSGSTSGTRRRRELISIYCVPGDTEHPPCPKGPPPENLDPLSLISENEFIAGSGTCSGDSGSGAFEQQSYNANAPVSFGVLSRGGEDGSKCEGSVYTRLDSHRDFIIQTAKLASQNWTLYAEPSWTGPFIAPAPKDAGTTPPKKDGGTTSTSSGGGGLLDVGEECTVESECASNICTDVGNGSGTLICSKDCDPADTSSCPDGFTCKESLLCLPTTVPTTPAGATTTTTSDCAMSSSSQSSPTSRGLGFGALSAVAIAALATRRRRRR